MKKFLYSLAMFIALLLISFSAIAYNPNAMTQLELNNQSMLAVNWVQQSGEYRALTHQAFNIAKVSFNSAVLSRINEPAIIVDLDETILDNSPYQASLIGSKLQKTQTTVMMPIKPSPLSQTDKHHTDNQSNQRSSIKEHK